MPSFNFKLIYGLALAAAVSMPACAQSASSATGQESLPAAPSAVLAAQDDSLGRKAGSDFKFTAPSRMAGPGVTVEAAQAGPLAISLDDAIALGLERNVRLAYDRANQREERGDTLSVVNALMPDLRLTGSSGTQELNLAAMGFKPSLVGKLLPAGYSFSTIVKVNVTQAQVSARQQLLNMTDIELYRGTKSETAVVDLNLLSSRGEVILATGIAYLQVLADQSNVANAQAQEKSSQTLYSQASDKLSAGVGIRLDALRAQVQYQQRQQETVAAQTQLAKDIIQLNRIIGLPAGQQLTLTDAVPLAEFDNFDLERAKATAYAHRKDLLSLQAQIDVARLELRAVKYQRLPTLAFNGYYGVLGETTGLYHGVFSATGSLKFPIFNEGEQRGQEEQIGAQLSSLRQRESDLRVAIDAQIRASMLDVQSSAELVKVAQSSVALAKEALSDENDRFKAGVDDNLPVVDAQASLVGAQAQLVQALYQYNVAKLQLARNTGVVETRYRTYLGK
jgi:outer membrane protein TolC